LIFSEDGSLPDVVLVPVILFVNQRELLVAVVAAGKVLETYAASGVKAVDVVHVSGDEC
jgi:hypothetical protein